MSSTPPLSRHLTSRFHPLHLSLAEALQAAREERERMLEVERAIVRENERVEEAIKSRKNEVHHMYCRVRVLL